MEIIMLKNKKIFIGVIVVVFISALALSMQSCSKSKKHEHDASGGEVLNYTCGMHPSVNVSVEEYEKGNKNCPICNMGLVPVYREEKPDAGVGEGTILFYRHPTDVSKTSSTPKKDEEGHDYIPVYEETGADAHFYGCGMEGADHIFNIKGIEGMKCPICGMDLKRMSKEEADSLLGVVSRVKVKGKELKRAGVKSEPARKLSLFKEIRTVGRVAYDPDLAIAEDEYLSALNAFGKMGGGNAEIRSRARTLTESAEKKLRLLGLSEEQIKEMKRTRKVHSSLVLPEKKMWIYGDIYEYELSWLKIGEKITVTANAFPGETFEGDVTSINPVLDPKTRSVRFRAEVDNPTLKLKPGMSVNIVIHTVYVSPDGEEKTLAIPKTSVLDTGRRKIVWFDKGDGLYEGREVVVGPEASATVAGSTRSYYPVIRGIKEGERVVTTSNFLIDSQSQLSGVAASSYGGALGVEDAEGETKTAAPVHQH